MGIFAAVYLYCHAHDTPIPTNPFILVPNMLSKKILLPVLAICGLSMSASFQSCETLNQLGGDMTAEQRQQLIGGLIFDGLNSLSGGGDSLTALAGVWVAASDGVRDTIVFTNNGQYQQHYASDSLNYIEKGTYVYYKSFRQALVDANYLFNCLTGKQVKWEQQYIYKVQLLNLSNSAGINNLTLEQLDNDPKSSTYGQSLGATQYSAVKVTSIAKAGTSSSSANQYRSTGTTQKTTTGTTQKATTGTTRTSTQRTPVRVLRIR